MAGPNDRADAGAAQLRRGAVLDSAMLTFARYGYRKASMEQVAQDARISRPGLYFLFSSKEELFQSAVTQTLESDLAEVKALLAEPGRPLQDRLLGAFDRWAGRYVGPLMNDVAGVIEDNPGFLGGVVESMPRRFEGLVVHAVAEGGAHPAVPLAQTLISVSIGIKHQVSTREAYLDRLSAAIGLLLG